MHAHALMFLAVALTGLAGCKSGITTSQGLSPQTVKLPDPVEGMPVATVIVRDINILPSVVLPPEMAEVSHDQLIVLARENIRHELGRSHAFNVLFLPSDSSSVPAGTHLLVGEITRIELSGSVEDQLSGMFGKAGEMLIGKTVEVKRNFVLGINYRILTQDHTAIAVGSGQSATAIPVSGTFAAETVYQDGKAEVRSSLVGGKVDRAALAPAFQLASSIGAKSLIENANQRWKLAEVPENR